jgi:hypothetical protein
MKEGELSLGMFEILLLLWRELKMQKFGMGVARCAPLRVNINFPCAGDSKIL